jgi:hypothetical protein
LGKKSFAMKAKMPLPIAESFLSMLFFLYSIRLFDVLEAKQQGRQTDG